MSRHERIYLTAAAPTQPPVDDLALSWICPICGRLRVFEGGRPMFGNRDECEQCGSALFVPPSHASPIVRSSLAW